MNHNDVVLRTYHNDVVLRTYHNDVVLRMYHNDVVIFIIFATYKYHLTGYSLKTWERQKKSFFIMSLIHIKTESYK